MHECCCVGVHQGGLVHRAALCSHILDPTTDIEAINSRFVHDTFVEVVVSDSKIHVLSTERMPSCFALPRLFWEHLHVCLLFVLAPKAALESRIVGRLNRFEVRQELAIDV